MTTDSQTPGTAAPAAEPAATPQAAAAPAAAPATPSPAAAAPAAPAAPASAATPAGADGKPADQKADDAKPEGAPTEYADFTVPEGAQLNTEAVGELKALAKEFNLSQDAAQKLVDLGIKHARMNSDALTANLEKVHQEWTETSRADKEFGGDKLDENIAIAKQTLATFGTPELTAFLESSKLGSHPELVRWAYRVGKAMSEDRHVPGGTKPGKSNDQALYANSNMNP